MVVGRDESEAVFKQFVQADSFTEIKESFTRVCELLDIESKEYSTVYKKLKEKVRTKDALNLWSVIDKRLSQDVYADGRICSQNKVFVIGAGPCGLRMAIEARLLGSQVVVVEMRDYVTRNNVLHLWPSVIHDLKSLGAKIFYRKFCTGSLDHISIRKLQSILLKVALLLGVEVHAPVRFIGLREPIDNTKGWTAKLEPEDHPAAHYEFDFIVGADGKRNSLSGFRRKCFRAKQAIAITFNLVNGKTKTDNQVEEIPGLFYIFAQDFFNNIKEKVNIDLENIVYFRDETHYFVMTAKKSSLLERGVLKEDLQDSHALLSKENVDREQILQYALDAAGIATNNKLSGKPFAKDHHGLDDIAIFDFTAIYKCEYSTVIHEKHGHDLVMTIVGDGLIEPFWPTGSGAGRGLLSVQDAAWTLRMRGMGKDPLECLAEKETLFQILQQADPGNLKTKYSHHSIDPASRYLGKTEKLFLQPEQVKHLYVRHNQALEDIPDIIPRKVATPKPQRKKATKRSQSHDTTSLLTWYQEKLSSFKDSFTVDNLGASWGDGLALCALVFMHRPNLINMTELKAENAKENIQMALDLIHREFGLESLVTPEDVINESGDSMMNKLALVSYLGQLQECLLKDSTNLGTQEPFPKKFQQAASVVLMELANKEPELMGMMGMNICLEQPSQVTTSENRLKNTIKDDEDSADVDRVLRKDTMGTNGDVKRERSVSDAKYGESLCDSEDEIQACSGIAMRRIKELQRKSAVEIDKPKKQVEGLSSVPLRGSVRKEKASTATEEAGSSPWDRGSMMGSMGSAFTLGGLKEQFSKSSKEITNASSDLCQVCGKPMYHVERTQANGFYMHKSCLRCSVCKCTLRIGNSHAHLPEGQKLVLLYCFWHAYQAGLFSTSIPREDEPHHTQPADKQPDENKDAGLKDLRDVADAAEEHNDGTVPNSSEDEFLDAEDIIPTTSTTVQLRNKRGSGPRPDSEYRKSTSVRLIMAQQITDGLEEVDTEGQELEERGKQVENTIKKQRPVMGTPINDPDIMDEWMDLMKRKQELKERESKLILQMKLLQLQDRQKQLLNEMKAQIAKLEVSADMEEALEQMNKNTTDLETNMTGIKTMITNLEGYLEIDSKDASDTDPEAMRLVDKETQDFIDIDTNGDLKTDTKV